MDVGLTRYSSAGVRTTSPLQPPSSPPPAEAEVGAGSERAASPALSTASTADDGGSSPVLPPLPQPTFNGRTLDLLTERSGTPPSSSGYGAPSTHYYTASWGSPLLQQHHTSASRPQPYAYSQALGSELSEDSPIRHLDFHTPFLRPAPTFASAPLDAEYVSQDGLISAAVLANRARRPRRGLTEDWIRQHTGGESAEANNWLSDHEGDSETSSLSESLPSDIDPEDLDHLTPTLKRILASRRLNLPIQRHQRQLTTETLRQEDFAPEFLDSAIPRMTLEDHDAMAAGEHGTEALVQERAPTPPPKDERIPEATPMASVPGNELPTLVPTPVPGPPRLKKKVPWKGKNIMVLLPWDDERGQEGKAPLPLREEEVNAILKDWRSQGYDVAGFNLGTSAYGMQDEELGRSRLSWPLTSDVESERARRSFVVSIPDRRDWDAYVEGLREAKLRALGVILGDEEPAPTISPAVSNLSRRTSMQYPPLPFSPPIPTTSAASSHLSLHANPFSPALLPGNGGFSTSQSSNPGSIASPASMHAQLHGKYNNRQSVSFMPGDHPFGSPFQYPQSHSPGPLSPAQGLYGSSLHRGHSPSMHNLGSIMSPASPLSMDGYFTPGTDVMSQMMQRQNLLQAQLAHQQQLSARGSPRLQEVREVEEDDDQAINKSPSKTPEARLFKHNASNSLQEEIDAAEYHLEEQMERELEHEDYSPHSEKNEPVFDTKHSVGHLRDISAVPQGLTASRYADDAASGPVLHHPQPHSRGHSLSQNPFVDSEDSAAEVTSLQARTEGKNDLSEVETNPSNLGTPVPDDSKNTHSRAISVTSNPWAAESDTAGSSKSITRGNGGHKPKPSFSKLNVAAKEFTFNPSNTFTPSGFSFSGSNFQIPVSALSASLPPVSATSAHFSHPSSASSKGKFNVAAPAFTPGNSEFSFSASGPSFKPDAPAFQPQVNFSDSYGSGSDAPRSSIFGNIDLSTLGITKPSKKSKAIPIVRPDSTHSHEGENELAVDEDGRITQGDSRFKRSRNSKNDGDSVPLFAEPSMPLNETSREQSPPKDVVPKTDISAGKENSAPSIDGDSAALAASEPSKDNANKDFAPWAFTQQNQADDSGSARPFQSRRYGSGLPAYGFPTASTDEDPSPAKEPEKAKSHKKSRSSLSASAKPFEFKPNVFNFTFGQASEPSKPAEIAPTMLPKPFGLSASRYARSPTPPARGESPAQEPHETIELQDTFSQQPQSPPRYEENQAHPVADREPTFEEIDAVMRQLNETEMEPTPPTAPRFNVEAPEWHQTSPTRQIQMPDLDASSPYRLQPQNLMRSDAPSPSPGRFRAIPQDPRIFTRVHEDPFVADTPPLQHLSHMDSQPPSEWDDVLSAGDEDKLHPRSQFFDNHVNNLVGGILAERLDPLERTLGTIQRSLDKITARDPSRRRDRRSMSGALSDADDEDEDDEMNPRRSLSPRRDKKLDRIRAVVQEAMATHSRPATAVAPSPGQLDADSVLKALEEMKEHFGKSLHLDFRGEDLKNIVEEAVERRMPASPKPIIDEYAMSRETEHKSRIASLEEAAAMRESEHQAKISQLEDRIFHADNAHTIRISHLEEALRKANVTMEEETKDRRAAEDRLSEVQRLLRISSEEETRLREALDEREHKAREIMDDRDQKVKTVEEQRAKTTMRIALLEAAQGNGQKTQSELQNRISVLEADLREARKEAQQSQLEADRALETARRHNDDAEQANKTNKDLRRSIDTLKVQMEESVRVREGFRGKLTDLQEEMAEAAREIAQENARRAKKEQELIARQEVLDARLQAEARTRERLETEIERLEAGEREGMRAVNDSKKLEALLAEARAECHNAQKEAMRYKREFEEARESGMSEVNRTRHYLQAEVDAANNQVNVVREALEHQIARLRGEVDSIKMEADTARAKSEMLLEEAETSQKSLVEEAKRKHADHIEDIQTQHDRQLQNALEDAQRHEQHLLERISLSSAKTEHLQDRVAHLEEKLEIANAAANAAATAAKTARSSSISMPSSQQVSTRGAALPEKISPQALRESIMVLQEQLQERETCIEKLEATIASLDPDAANKITKRDDEIMWLRELIEVRKGDLQDIVQSLEGENYDPERVRNAAIRLRTNIQMEEQERERALNGGSAINLPNLAASVRDIASPRVAQAVGPLAAAWGSWRKGRADSSISETMLGDRRISHSSTPSKSSPGAQGFLGGLLTPPTSTSQPTAFGSTGSRFTSAQLANRPRVPMRGSPKVQRGVSAPVVPQTPPMLRKASYDTDARVASEDFGSDAGFFDDESPIDGSVDYGAGPGPVRRL